MNVMSLPKDATPDAIIATLQQDGAVVIERILNEADTRTLTADAEYWLERAPHCNGNFFGFKTKRVGTMVEKSAICRQMILHPTILAVMDHFLLPHCTQYQLMVSQLISISPGERQQIIHADDPMFPFPKPVGMQVMVNVMWAIDDFTEQNGATHIVPGSHLWPRGERQPRPEEICQGVMPKGSCLIWLGASYHGGGANMSDQPRRGIVMSYNLGWMKSQENYYLSIPLETIRTYPEKLQSLLGFFVHLPNLNTVEGRDPAELLQAGASEADTSGKLKEYKEFIPSAALELLEQYYAGQDVSATEDVYKHQSQSQPK
jgi:ectoine hydroxylase-related dioxygenase (phytanoyl-CoA dioxygenase family)